MMRSLSLLLTAALVAAAARAAAAQPANGQAAEALFREGKTLMLAGKLAEACEAFDGSYRKDPATSTLLNVADCREKNGQFASAWGAFVEAERRSRNSDDASQQAINQLAKDRASRLEPRLSYLTISVPDDSRVDGLTITRDGDPLDAAEWNRAIPIDVGPHVIEAKAPAYEPWTTRLEMAREKEQLAVTVPRFKPLPKAKLGGNVIRIIEPSPFTPKRKLAVGIGGLGVVAVGGGIALYFMARSDYDESKRTVDDTKQVALWHSANDKLLLSQVAAGLGVAALGTATFLWFTGKPTVTGESALTVAPTISPALTGLALAGTF
jgi:tetratricopeptide (TPR) repeat protein